MGSRSHSPSRRELGLSLTQSCRLRNIPPALREVGRHTAPHRSSSPVPQLSLPRPAPIARLGRRSICGGGSQTVHVGRPAQLRARRRRRGATGHRGRPTLVTASQRHMAPRSPVQAQQRQPPRWYQRRREVRLRRQRPRACPDVR